MAKWFYELDGQTKGPVDPKSLKRLANNGTIRSSTLVWKEGMSKKVKAASVKGLIAPPPPPRQSPGEETAEAPDSKQSSRRIPKKTAIALLVLTGFALLGFFFGDSNHPSQITSGSAESDSSNPDAADVRNSNAQSEIRFIEKTPVAFDLTTAVGHLSFSQNGRFLLVNEGRLLDVSDGTLLDIEMPAHNGKTATLSPDGTRLFTAVTAGADTTISLWDLSVDEPVTEQKVKIEQFYGSVGEGLWMSVAADGNHVLVASGRDARVLNFAVSPCSVVEIRHPTPDERYGHPPLLPYQAVFANKESVVVAFDSRSSVPQSVHVFRATSGRHMQELKLGGGSKWSQSPIKGVSPSGGKLATSCIGEPDRIWNTSNWTIEFQLDDRFDSFTPQGDIFVIGDNGLSLRNGTENTEKVGFHSPLMVNGDVIQSTDSRRLVRRSIDKPIQVWDWENGELVASIGRFEGIRSYSAAITPDGNVVATGHPDGLVAIWKLSDGEMLSPDEYAQRLGVVIESEDRLRQKAPPVPLQVYERIAKGMMPHQVHRLVGGQPLDDASQSEFKDLYTAQGGLAGTKWDWTLVELYRLEGDESARIVLMYQDNSTTPPLVEKTIVRP